MREGRSAGRFAPPAFFCERDYEIMPYTINGIAQDAGALPEPTAGDGVTFVPLAAVAEMLGGFATWDNVAKTTSIELGDHKATVTADSDSVEADSQTITLQAQTYLVDSKVWVPVRFFESALNCEVHTGGGDVNIQMR
jgi:hypothetical protein